MLLLLPLLALPLLPVAVVAVVELLDMVAVLPQLLLPVYSVLMERTVLTKVMASKSICSTPLSSSCASHVEAAFGSAAVFAAFVPLVAADAVSLSGPLPLFDTLDLDLASIRLLRYGRLLFGVVVAAFVSAFVVACVAGAVVSITSTGIGVLLALVGFLFVSVAFEAGDGGGGGG